MELFFSDNILGNKLTLNEDESAHCVKVLRHREGDEISVIDGKGTLFECRIITATAKKAEAVIMNRKCDWGAHPYILNMAVCPTKNADRYEWFAEKACEIGVDRIIPVIGDHSERKVIKTARLEKILLSATKQSLKADIPSIQEATSVREFISGAGQLPGLKLIAYCFDNEEMERTSIRQAVEKEFPNIAEKSLHTDKAEITIMIGPEGDFSQEEAALAIKNGFIPVHLGPSRLRTETAALTAVNAVYCHFSL